jgi:hypothetical protein
MGQDMLANRLAFQGLMWRSRNEDRICHKISAKIYGNGNKIAKLVGRNTLGLIILRIKEIRDSIDRSIRISEVKSKVNYDVQI